MATGIPYADDVLNVVVGCTPVSAGCDHCWACKLHNMRYIAKLKGANLPKQYDKPFSEVQLFRERLAIPAKRRKPTRFMMCSVADIFHEDVPDHFICKAWRTMIDNKRHTFLIFTKRIRRAWDVLNRALLFGSMLDRGLPLNVQLIASVEDQATADERIPLLLECPVAVRGVSYEPALGPVDFSKWPGLDWIIFGGESGKDARPCQDDWAYDAMLQCWGAGVAFYMKQRGSRYGRDHAKFETFPEHLQVREYPKGI